jgi:hypothetical protein
MNKKTKFARNGALLIGGIAGLKNAVEQYQSSAPGEPFHWDRFFMAILKGGFWGGVGGFALGAICDYQNSLEAPINTDKYLLAFVRENVLRKDDPIYLQLNKKAELLANLLKRRFSDEVKAVPYKYGSSENGTGLKDHADIDLCMECYPGSFASLEVMYFSVKDFLKSLVGSHGIVRIREQRVSIGVYFFIREEEYKIDVTPKKLTYNSSKDTSGFLHLNKGGIFKGIGRTKTNVRLLKTIQLSEPQKKILLVLKKIKESNNLPLASSLLQLFVLYTYDAYRGSIPSTLTKKVLLVLQYIADNIESIVIRSPENTNNVLTDSLTSAQKSQIHSTCREIIEEYDYQANSILGYLD